jgi:DNA-binding transcriptional regulator YiaG
MEKKQHKSTTANIIQATQVSPRDWTAISRLREEEAQKIDQTNFESFLEDNGISSRKDFCSIFGIAESTLSGWLSGKGIPANTARLIELARDQDIYGEQIRQMGSELTAAQYDMRVVEDGTTYSVVQFSFEGNEGDKLAREVRQPVGKIVARGIPDRETALSLTRAQPLLRMLRHLKEEITDEGPHFEPFSAGFGYRKDLLGELNCAISRLSKAEGGDG